MLEEEMPVMYHSTKNDTRYFDYKLSMIESFMSLQDEECSQKKLPRIVWSHYPLHIPSSEKKLYPTKCCVICAKNDLRIITGSNETCVLIFALNFTTNNVDAVCVMLNDLGIIKFNNS